MCLYKDWSHVSKFLSCMQFVVRAKCNIDKKKICMNLVSVGFTSRTSFVKSCFFVCFFYSWEYVLLENAQLGVWFTGECGGIRVFLQSGWGGSGWAQFHCLLARWHCGLPRLDFCWVPTLQKLSQFNTSSFPCVKTSKNAHSVQHGVEIIHENVHKKSAHLWQH